MRRWGSLFSHPPERNHDKGGGDTEDSLDAPMLPNKQRHRIVIVLILACFHKQV